MAAADQSTVTELRQILSTTGMNFNGLKTHLFERIKQANLMQRLKNPEATEILLQRHGELQRGMGAPGGEAKVEAAAAEVPAAATETTATGAKTETEPTGEPTAEETGATALNWK